MYVVTIYRLLFHLEKVMQPSEWNQEQDELIVHQKMPLSRAPSKRHQDARRNMLLEEMPANPEMLLSF